MMGMMNGGYSQEDEMTREEAEKMFSIAQPRTREQIQMEIREQLAQDLEKLDLTTADGRAEAKDLQFVASQTIADLYTSWQPMSTMDEPKFYMEETPVENLPRLIPWWVSA